MSDLLKSSLKRYCFIILILFFSLFIGIKTRIGFFHLFFWFLSIISALSVLTVLIEYLVVKLELSRDFLDKIESDDTLEVRAAIKNKTFFPAFNIVLEDYCPCSEPVERQRRIFIGYLRPRYKLKLAYNWHCINRGKHTIGPLRVYFFDPFGIFFLKKDFGLSADLFVYPKTFYIKEFPSLLKGSLPWFGIGSLRVSIDEDEFYGVREYKTGDPLKSIHWITSGRKNKLIVKQFQRQTFFRATIIFNLKKEEDIGGAGESLPEYIIKIVASVAKYLVAHDVSLEIIAHVGEIVQMPANKGPEHLDSIFKFLAAAKAESRIGIDQVFEEFSPHIPNDSTLITVMSDKDWEYFPALLSLQMRNVFLIPIILVSPTFLYPIDTDEEIQEVRKKTVQEFHIDPIFISRRTNLEEVFQ